jgi:NAD(P) transhydrogenase subunit alpha
MIERLSATRKTLCRAVLGAACVFASSISIAQEATKPTPATAPAATDLPQSTPVPSLTEPAASATAPATSEITVSADSAKVDATPHEAEQALDFSSMLFVFMLATIIGLGVIMRVSRLLHTPLMSLTNAISAIAVVGAIIVTGNPNNSLFIRILGTIALFASTTNIVSGFLITDRMLKMFKQPGEGGKR